MKQIITIVFMLLCLSCFAQTQRLVGSGTEDDPYLISSEYDLFVFGSNSDTAFGDTLYYFQTCDIYFSNMAHSVVYDGFFSYGQTYAPFNGVFDGNNKRIIYDDNLPPVTGSFMGYTDGAVLKNINLVNLNLSLNYEGGGLVNSANYTTFQNCSVSGTITTNQYYGGLVNHTDNCTIEQCFVDASITADEGTNPDIGGLIRHCYNSSVSNSFVKGSIDTYSSGGLVYDNWQSTIRNCYANVENIDNQDMGGIFSSTTNFTGDSLQNNVWNSDLNTSDQSNIIFFPLSSDEVLAATTAEMQLESTYTSRSWDFIGETVNGTDDIWGIHPQVNDGLPYLTVFNPHVTSFVSDSTTVYVDSQIQFTDTTNRNPSSWEWDFDNDGNIDSNQQNPTYSYELPGTYTVSLITVADSSTITTTKQDYITVNPLNQPDIVCETDSLIFGAVPSQQSVTLPIVIQNIGSVTLNITDFPSTNPAFSVQLLQQTLPISLAPGSSQQFEVEFSPGSGGEFEGVITVLSDDPIHPQIQINVHGTGNSLTADFEAHPQSGDVPLSVQFVNNSSGNITSYLWDFGDGFTSTDEYAFHEYTTPGTYTVTLSVSDGSSQSEKIETDYIVVNDYANISTNLTTIDFGTIYLSSVRPDSTVIITNTGVSALEITDISVSDVEGVNGFNYNYPNMYTTILSNASEEMQVSFTPQNVGEYQASLILTNNSNASPTYTIQLTGICEYNPPLNPENVTIITIGNDAQISWDQVTEDIFGNSITPNGYIVLYNESPNSVEEDFYFLQYVSDSTAYTHQNVGYFRDNMYYQVKTYISYDPIRIEGLELLNTIDSKEIRKGDIEKYLK